MKNLMMSLVILTTLSSCGKEILKTGPMGPQGASGINGVDGTNGTSCNVAEVDPSVTYPNGGAVITCGSSVVVVKNGATGATGAAGADAVQAVIDPCGNAPGVYDEVLLQLADGTLLASFSANASGLNTRFAVLPAGNYTTTDGTNCNFTVDSSGNVN